MYNKHITSNVHIKKTYSHYTMTITPINHLQLQYHYLRQLKQ